MSISASIASEIEKLGGSQSDDVWLWLTQNGPHGPSFTWSQTRESPPGYVGVVHLAKIVREKTEADSTFMERAESVIRAALHAKDEQLLRRAIQVAAVVGSKDTLSEISGLTTHVNSLVAADARASQFYLRQRLRAAKV